MDDASILPGLKTPIHSGTQSDDQTSCYGKPAELFNEIKGYVISLVRSIRFAVATDPIVGLNLIVDRGLKAVVSDAEHGGGGGVGYPQLTVRGTDSARAPPGPRL